MKAKLLIKEKTIFDDGSILELVLWELPEKTVDRIHGYKYRMYYGNKHGKCLVRYDNESGKGDHKHIGKRELPFQFIDLDTLFNDFELDVAKCRDRINGRKQ